MTNLFFLVLFFVFGASVGSLISVVITRIRHNQKGIILGRSQCPKCKKRLHWQHLIPVLSYILLKGRCAHCSKEIGKIYIALEIVTGAVFAFIFTQNNFFIGDSVHGLIQNSVIEYGVFWLAIYQMIIYSILILIFVYDYLYQEIPDLFSVPLIIVGLIGTILSGVPTLGSMLIGGLIGVGFFGGQYLISKGKWIGEGDIRLGFFMGVFLGWQLMLIAIVISYLVGSIVSLFLLSNKKAKMSSEIAFGPFLIVGLFIAQFWGKAIVELYLGLY